MRKRIAKGSTVGSGWHRPSSRRLSVASAVAIGALALPLAAGANAATLAVGPSSPGAADHPYDGATGCASPAYATLAAAHGAATAGDTILLCPGTYSGATTITKADLTIVGAGRSSTTLESASGTAVVTLGAGAGGTTIRDLSVSSGGAVGVSGIYTNAALSDVRLRGLRIFRADTPYLAYGVTIHNNGIATDWQVDDVTINGYGVGFRVRGQAHGLTIRDSSFDGNSEGMSSVVGSPAPSTPQLTGLLVQRTSFNDNRNKGVYFETLSGATFEQIEVVGSGLSAGTHPTPHAFEVNLKGGPAEDIAISDARIVGSDGAGINIKARDDQSAGTSLSGVTITGTVVTGNAAGVTFGNAVSSATVTGSTIEGNHGVGLVNDTPTPVVATGNYWGCSGGPGTPGCDGVESPQGAAAVDASAPLAVPAVGRRYVTATGGTDTANDCLTEAAPCATVQHGVDQAQPGDTVQLGAGAFSGAVTAAGKRVTIAGASRDGSRIEGPAAFADLPVCVGAAKAVVCAETGATLAIRDLTVDGNEAGVSGVGFADADGTVTRVKTTRTRDPYVSGAMSGAQRGQGVEALAAGGVARVVTVEESLIEDFQKNGIRASGADLTIRALGNTVRCSGPQPVMAANGITVFNGASGSLIGNIVSDCRYAGPLNTSSIGLLVQDPEANVVVEGNDVTGSDRGLFVRATPSSVISVQDNTFTANTLAIDVDDAGPLGGIAVGTNSYVGNGTAINGIGAVQLETSSLAFGAKAGAYAGRQRATVKAIGGSVSIRSIEVEGDEDVFDVNASACTSGTLEADETCTVWVNAMSAVEGDFAGALKITTRDAAPIVGATGLTAAIAGTLDGVDGSDGVDGNHGSDGTPGTPGAPGAPGAVGATGATGAPGADGADGTDGRNGADGAKGDTGAPGAAGPTGPTGLTGAKGDQGAAGPLVLAVSPMRITDETSVVVATVVCPAGACKLAARSATLKVGKRTFKLKLRTTSRVAQGKAGTVTLVLSKAARRALSGGAKGVATVRITVGGKRAPVIKATLRGAKQR